MSERKFNAHQLRILLSNKGFGFHDIAKLIKGQKLRDALDAGEDLDAVKAVVHALITGLYSDHEYLRNPPHNYTGPLKKNVKVILEQFPGPNRYARIVAVHEAESPGGERVIDLRIYEGPDKGEVIFMGENEFRSLAQSLEDHIPFE
ncbi:hypothetical protein CcrBL47_gp383 [Caulobacter phage BL47]|nr:hypothetical protein CcrBL47_gp383 [Caulobacter phage BL47]